MLRNQARSGIWLIWESIASFATLMVMCFQGCGSFGDRPELYPDKWAPARADREWMAPPAIESQVRVRDSTTAGASPGTPMIQTGQEYDLPKLIDIALINNPETRRAWSAARSAAAV